MFGHCSTDEHDFFIENVSASSGANRRIINTPYKHNMIPSDFISMDNNKVDES